MPPIEDHPDSLKNDPSLVNKKLFNPDSFAALCRVQAEILHETGWRPSLNKLASALVNADTLSYLKEMMLLEFKHSAGTAREKYDTLENQTD